MILLIMIVFYLVSIISHASNLFWMIFPYLLIYFVLAPIVRTETKVYYRNRLPYSERL